MRRERVDIEFVCRNLTGSYALTREGVHLGIQIGEQVEQEVPIANEPALFRLFVYVREGKLPGTVDFGGEAVKGTAEERFVYLSWGVRSGYGWDRFARTKVPLTRITPELLNRVLAEGRPLRANLRLLDERGRNVAALRGEEQVIWE